jgi:glycosyltransferase involved in cell wall biosynthesis
MLRVLFVSNYYPPSSHGGGFMQLCEEVADGLSARGHAIAVLTSTYCDGDEIVRSYPVYRLVHIDPDWHSDRSAAQQFFIGRRQRERQAVAHLHQVVAEFRPDIVFIWHTLGLPRSLLKEAEQLPSTVAAYYLADYVPEFPDEYLTYWQSPPVHWAAKLFKRPLARIALGMLAREGKPISLEYKNSICVSDYVHRRLVSKKLIPSGAVVIHNGVDLSCFSPDTRDTSRFLSGHLRFLVAGRIVPDKGIHTIIEALALLQARSRLDGITLTILGDGPADYTAYLRQRVQQCLLQDAIEFRAPVPREHMPQILAQHDGLFLASEYNEPLARAMQEAMAMGLLVIGTTTGGSGELLAHEETGLVFEAADSESLAQQLERVAEKPESAKRLAMAGTQRVIKEFNIEHTIERIEEYLSLLVCDTDRTPR